MSKYFTIEELTNSCVAKKKGIDNTPDAEHTKRLQYLADNVLDPLRERWGAPLTVTSGYRSKELNDAVKGVKNSQHLSGKAADLQCMKPDKFNIARLFNLAVEMDKQGIISCDQIIIEHNIYTYWVHISSKMNSEENRHQYFALAKN